MSKELSLDDLHEEMRAGFSQLQKQVADLRGELRDDLRHVRQDIIAIHSDLIKHDERADKMLDMLQGRSGIKEIRVQ